MKNKMEEINQEIVESYPESYQEIIKENLEITEKELRAFIISLIM